MLITIYLLKFLGCADTDAANFMIRVQIKAADRYFLGSASAWKCH